MNVTNGWRDIEFGDMSVFSRVTKPFIFTNNHKESVLVKIDWCEHEELKSGVDVQIVPPSGIAAFDIALYSDKQRVVNQNISYVINNYHTYPIHIHANFTPVEINLSADRLFFEFAPSHLEFDLSEKILMTNPGTYEAKYEWETNSTHFTVEPRSGTIGAGKSASAVVTFIPPQGGDLRPTANLVLHIAGGDDKLLSLEASLEDARCAWTDVCDDVVLYDVVEKA